MLLSWRNIGKVLRWLNPVQTHEPPSPWFTNDLSAGRGLKIFLSERFLRKKEGERALPEIKTKHEFS